MAVTDHPFRLPVQPEHAAFVRMCLKARLDGDAEFFKGLPDNARTKAVLSTISMLEDCDQRFRGVFEKIITEIIDFGFSETMQEIVMVDYSEVPVPASVFYGEARYMGRYGEGIYPANMKDMCWILDPANEIIEAILTGSIRWGKTTMAVCMFVYRLYVLSLLRSPQTYFGLMEGSAIRYGIFNLFKYKTADMYNRVREMVDNSPYFKERFARQKANVSDQLRFPRNIEVLSGSTELHALGETLIGAILDEMNFMRKADRRNRATAMEELGQAQKLYTAIRERARLQFLASPGGITPWMLMLLSQRRAQTDFLEVHIKEHGLDPGTCVVSRAIWDVQPPGTYSGKTFFVVIGDEVTSSRIVEADTKPPHDGNLLEVPEEHYTEFELNLDEAIRNVGGRATVAASSLFRRREVLERAVITGRELGLVHPFRTFGVTISDKSPITLEDIVKDEIMFSVHEGHRRARLDPTSPRVMHIDLASTDCSAGIACVHFQPEGIYNKVVVDFVLQINPPPKGHGEIDFEKIVDFVLWLRDNGFTFKQVSFDQYQSRHSQTALRKRGIESKYISVDTSDEPYIHLRGVYESGLIAMYEHQVLTRELSQLEHDITTRKVLKPSNGSKDVADALCGAVYGLMPPKPGFAKPTMIQVDSGPTNVVPIV